MALSSNFYIFICILQLGFAAQLLPHLGYFIVMKQVECLSNPSYIIHTKCEITPLWNRSINLGLKVIQPLSALTSKVQIFIPNSKKEPQNIFNLTFDVCKSLAQSKRKPVIEFLFNSITNGKHVNTRCPLRQGQYTSNNLTLVNGLPPVLGESDFVFNVNFVIPKATNVMTITLHGHLFENAKENARKWKYF